MMRTSIFTQQPLPTHLSIKDTAVLVYKPFSHYITKFQILAEKQKTSLFYNQWTTNSTLKVPFSEQVGWKKNFLVVQLQIREAGIEKTLGV